MGRRLQYGTLMVTVAAVSVLRVDGRRAEQTNFVIPHQSLFVDAVEDRKLADGEQFIFLVHLSNFLLTVLLLYGLL